MRKKKGGVVSGEAWSPGRRGQWRWSRAPAGSSRVWVLRAPPATAEPLPVGAALPSPVQPAAAAWGAWPGVPEEGKGGGSFFLRRRHRLRHDVPPGSWRSCDVNRRLGPDTGRLPPRPGSFRGPGLRGPCPAGGSASGAGINAGGPGREEGHGEGREEGHEAWMGGGMGGLGVRKDGAGRRGEGREAGGRMALGEAVSPAWGAHSSFSRSL